MKKFFSMLSLIAVMAFAVTSVTMTSCVDSGSNVEPIPLKEGDYSATLNKDAVKNSDGVAIADEIVVSYVSLAPDMKNLQVVSGAITLPKDRANMYGIVLDNHYTITSDKECPSQAAGTDISHIDMVGGAFCVVSTDYIGYGATKGMMHPYLNHEVCARHSIELAKIAVRILKEEFNITGKMMFNTGYSQGGGVAMAVHREMEKDPTLASQLGFVGTWCGDGPYDVESTTKFYLENADRVSYPVALPLLVEGFLSSAPTSLKGDLEFADFFNSKMTSAGLESWMSKREQTSTQINKRMADVVGGGTLKVSDIFSPEMAVESGALMQKYLQFARTNDMTKGWQPAKYPLRVIHWLDDDVVPVINAVNAQQGLGLDSEAVTYVPTIMFEQQLAQQGLTANPTHADFGPVFYGLAALEIIGILTGGK